jgi:hypothetical protein
MLGNVAIVFLSGYVFKFSGYLFVTITRGSLNDSDQNNEPNLSEERSIY